MNRLLFGLLITILLISCSKIEEGFLGEWEGKTERLNSDGDLIGVDISCTITPAVGNNRNVVLSVGGANYEFEALEEMDMLTYKDVALNSDSIIISYISGNAEILNDTILHFDYQVYALKNNALLYAEKEELDMVRK